MKLSSILNALMHVAALNNIAWILLTVSYDHVTQTWSVVYVVYIKCVINNCTYNPWYQYALLMLITSSCWILDLTNDNTLVTALNCFVQYNTLKTLFPVNEIAITCSPYENVSWLQCMLFYCSVQQLANNHLLYRVSLKDSSGFKQLYIR
jgi:hypothetical protein